MTKVNVLFFKDGGKLNYVEKFKTNTPVYETKSIENEIKFTYSDTIKYNDIVFIATSADGTEINSRLIKNPNISS